MIDLKPGVPLATARALLGDLAREAVNLSNGVQAVERLDAWRTWSPRAALRAGSALAPRTVDSIVRGPRYGVLHEVAPAVHGASLAALIDSELDELRGRIAQARAEIEEALRYWGHEAVAVLLDTNLLMHAGPRLARIDWDALLHQPTRNVAFTIPIVAVEELDKLKLNRNSDTRGRAVYALKWLRQLLAEVPTPRPFETRASGTTLRVWVDDNSRLPLPEPDRDIIDRAQQLALMTKRTVIASMDQSMILRARAYGVDAVLVTEEDIPARTKGQS
ncbi:PIN domain-containing protein [Curtobacterium sp. MCPF17_052]|uniref:PIN domain-containing protein n=1 Tax=Curtobacterium sp. MCPF17_052 TaxID=2175655 RepID=UPI0011B66C4F|nr:PIN domain-containing protein [Curtobacterium sp. MCPF17_052]WIB13302.1 PIN domain-containing protein [Curtobacterium sp. MCPF17_052]